MKKIRKRSRDEVPALNDKELGNVNGGGGFAITSNLNTKSCKHVHNNCGGVILNVGNPFAYCRCSKCGKEHYWLYSFGYTVVYEDQ